jgi:TP901 family phage tail tape measure protein
MSDGRVIIDITADTSEYEKAVASLNESTTKRVNLISQGMQSAGKGLTLGLTAPILAFSALSAKAAMDFESSFAGVRKTVDATEEEYARLKQAAKDMSEQKVVSANQVNDIMALAGQLGIYKENLVDYAGVIADLEVSTNLGAEQAATQIAQYANITNMAQEDTSRFGSTIVDLGNNFATTEADIMNMSMRVAAAGHQIGLTDAETLALSASLASVGINAEAGGTAISTIMSQIDKDVALQTDTLQTWADVAGMSVADFSDAWKNRPVEALQAVFEGMSKVQTEGGNLNLVLDELGVTSLRQTDVMKRLGNASELFGTAVGTATNAWSENSALAEEAGKRYETTESSMAMLKNTLTNTAAEMGGPLLGAINELIGGAKPFLDVVKGIAKGFSEASPGTQKLIIGLVATLAAIGPVTTAFGKFMEVGNRFQEGLRGIAAAMKAEGAAAKAMVASSAQVVAAEDLMTAKKQAAVSASQLIAAKKAQLAIQEEIATKKRLGTLTQEEFKQLSADAAKQKSIVTSTRYTLAKEKEAIAEAQANVAKAAGIPITTGLTVATRALSAAIKANPLMFAIMAVMILLPLMTALANAHKKATDGTNELTQASKKQKAVVDAAQKSYDRAASEQGELSDAALAAKGALDAESASFEATKQTMGEFTAETDKLVDSHNQLVQSIDESYASADAQTGALMHLQATISDLAGSANGSAESEAALATQISALNEICPEAAASLDAQTLAQGSATEAGRAQLDILDSLVEKEKGRIQLQAAQEHYSDLIQEEFALRSQLEEAVLEQTTAEEGLAEAVSNTAAQNIWLDASVQQFSATAGKAGENVTKLSDALQENAEKQQQARMRATELATHQLKVEEAAKKAAKGYKYTAQELSMLGITEQEVTNEITASEAEQALAVEQAKSQMAQAIDEYIAKNGDFAKAMQESGFSSEDLATKLSGLGLSFGDLTGYIDSAVSQATDGFHRLTSESEISLDEWLSNLEANRVAMEGWGDNLNDVFSRTGVSFSQGFVDEMIGGGVEKYGAFIAQMASMSDADLQAVVDQFDATGAEATEAIVTPFGDIDLSAEGSAAMGTFTDGMGEAAQSGDTSSMEAVGSQLTDSLAESITAGTPDVQASVDTLFETISASDLNIDLSPVGAKASASLAQGITSGKGRVTSAAKVIQMSVMTTLLAMKLQPVGAQAAMQFAVGVNSGTGAARSAGAAIGAAAISGARSGSGGGYSIGYQMAAGVASGIAGGRSMVANAMVAIVSAGIAAGRRAADINSPARKPRKLIGQPIGEGTALGITDMTQMVDRAMDTMIDGAIESGQKGMHALIDTLDLSSYDFTGFEVDTSGLENRSAAMLGTSETITNNYYSIDGIDISGDKQAEEAVEVVLSRYKRKGLM